MQYKIGAMCMQVMENEIKRYQQWSAELEKKKNNILLVRVLLGLNFFFMGGLVGFQFSDLAMLFCFFLIPVEVLERKVP